MARTQAQNKAVTTAPDEQERITLYSPQAVEYRTADPREITRLKARGYRTEKPADKSPEQTDTTQSAS